MKSKKTNLNAGWSIFLGILILIAFFYVIDWSFLRGGITEYAIRCTSDYKEGNGCYSLNTSTYYPDKHRQQVVKKDDFSIETLKKCTVIDRRNWECKWDDESAVFGFNDGQFHSYALDTAPGSFSDKLDRETHYVSRIRWLLESWNII